jgi:hypothetical protein
MKKLFATMLVLAFAAGFVFAGSNEYHQCRGEKPKKYCNGSKQACEKAGCAVLQTISGKPADYSSSKVFVP